MGVNLKDLIIRNEISIESLARKKLVVDGNNILYQFLSTIRQADGSLLTDKDGNVTSHLNGLFHRTSKLMQSGLKLCFVFDGKAPDLKLAEIKRRAGIKKDAADRFEKAERDGNVEDMKKYAQRTSRLTREMIEEAKELLDAMGIPVVQAASEGEAQAAYMAKQEDVYAEVSQDYDCLLFGVPRMITNLTISGRKKIRSKLAYETIKPTIIDLQKNLENLGLSQEQLIAIGILVGTDFNIGGIHGLGPKKAIKLVKEYGTDFDGMFKKVEWSKSFDVSWETVFDLFKNMPVEQDYNLEWGGYDADRIKDCLVERHGFSVARVEDTLKKLDKNLKAAAQTGLGAWVK